MRAINNGPSGGTTTTSPLPEEPGPGLIFQYGEGVANGIKIVEQHGSIYEFSVPGKNGNVSVISEMTQIGNKLVLNGLHIQGAGSGRAVLVNYVVSLAR